MTMTTVQYAWAIYFAGSLGCSIAAWWFFLWAWRFVRYAAVITVMTILFTPYAIDPQTMTMAPAIYTLVFEGMSQGFIGVKPLIKVMVGIWLIGLILALVFVILTRNIGGAKKERGSRKPAAKRGARRNDYVEQESRSSSRGLSREEYHAREELLKGEVPIRAIRD